MTMTASISANNGSRIAWIDSVRGIGIVLVVTGHALGGLIDAPAGAASSWLRYAFLAIYAFHMPLFFILAGLFVGRRLQRGIPDFLTGLLVTTVYPYFLWSILQFSAIYLLGSLVNHPVNQYWPTILALPWRTVSQFWFLHALFLLHLMAASTWPIGGRYAVLAAALVAKIAGNLIIGPKAFHLAAGNAPYYALGIVLGPQGIATAIRMTPPWLKFFVPLAALAAILLMLSQAEQFQHRHLIASASSAGLAWIAWRPTMVPAALLGSFAILIVAAQAPLPGLLARLGRQSMTIFLLHILFLAGIRIIATRMFGISGPELLLPLVLVGIAGPLAVGALADRWRLRRLLGFG